MDKSPTHRENLNKMCGTEEEWDERKQKVKRWRTKGQGSMEVLMHKGLMFHGREVLAW